MIEQHRSSDPWATASFSYNRMLYSYFIFLLLIFYHLAPSITTITPASTEGGLVTILGSNFGANDSSISVSFGPYSCTNVQVIYNHTLISCFLSTGVGLQLEAAVYLLIN